MPSQLEAFACFSALIERWLPEYVKTDLRGVHRGADVSHGPTRLLFRSDMQLLDQCLRIVDPELYDHLMNRGLEANLYAFASVLTMCTCTPPLDELLKLWE